MGWKKLVILGLFLSLYSCISFYKHPKGGFRPKKPNFSLNKQKFIYNSLIDTMGIYTKTDTLKYGKFKSVSYLKFFNNGRFFKNSFKPSDGIKSNFKPSLIGFYNTSNDNSIRTEYFKINALDKNETEYVLENGIIKGDSLIFNNRFVPEKKDIYIKQKIYFTPEPSNW